MSGEFKIEEVIVQRRETGVEREARLFQEEKNKEILRKKRIADLKSSRDNRGKFDVRFDMTAAEVLNIAGWDKNIWGDLYKGELLIWLSDEYVDVIERRMGLYTDSESLQIIMKLKSRYTSFIEPTLAEIEKSVYNASQLQWVFQNNEKNDNPKWIIFRTYVSTTDNRRACLFSMRAKTTQKGAFCRLKIKRKSFEGFITQNSCFAAPLAAIAEYDVC